MARNVSPFAALTSEEKQIKWMEYQTIRLPYTQVSNPQWPQQTNDHSPSVATSVSTCDTHQPAEPVQPKPVAQPAPNHQPARPLPPPEVMYHPMSPSDNRALSPYQQINAYQKTRHRQYDTVIERMKQAEKKTGCFREWAK